MKHFLGLDRPLTLLSLICIILAVMGFGSKAIGDQLLGMVFMIMACVFFFGSRITEKKTNKKG